VRHSYKQNPPMFFKKQHYFPSGYFFSVMFSSCVSISMLTHRHVICLVEFFVSKDCNLLLVLYGYKTLSLTLRELHSLKVSESRLFSAEENIWTEEVGENERIMKSFITCTVRQTKLGYSSRGRGDRQGM
jgi:hypothetical protein